MGTSSSFGGPKNGTSLLPPFATPPSDSQNGNNGTQDNSQQGQNNDSKNIQNPDTGKWSTAKGNLSRYVRNRGNTGSTPKKAVQSYVRASGGSSGASRAARSGKISVGGYGNFLRGIASDGINKTLENYNLKHLIGKPSEQVFAAIADSLAPTGATNEDAVARKAILESLQDLFTEHKLESNDISTLNNLSEEELQDYVLDATGTYVFSKFVEELSIAIEKGSIDKSEAYDIEVDVEDYIRGRLESEFKDRDILSSGSKEGFNKRIMDEIFEKVYKILED
ncbi:Qat anti-phage system associated protein QatB [uncultured Microscilla sp.]|uniref:Qat anti-phage system associated protein QatB n=1 Tax=uncultured Microscilla sp. TaxID=432653 RepID=UPI0026233324|nr:Qat anti-phage system associated protein QatB [uncultured Microscilla sp.]